MTTDTIDTSTFGRYIRSLRLYGRGLPGARTQRQIGTEAGIPFVDLSKMESHRIPPSFFTDDAIARLMAVLDADPEIMARLVRDWQPAPPDPPGWSIACGPSGCRVQRVGGETP